MTNTFRAILALCLLTQVSFASTYIKQGALIEGVTTTLTTGGNTSLNKDSQTIEQFTGTNVQNVILPDATTIPVGRKFYVTNRSTQSITIKDFSGTGLITIPTGAQSYAVLISNGTSAGNWDVSSIQALSGGVNGPGVSTDRAIATWNGTTGTTLRNTGIVVDASDNLIWNSFTIHSTEVASTINNEPLTTFTLVDNTSSPTPIETWSASTFSAVTLFYSIARGTGNSDNGELFITTSGSLASVADQSASLGDTGVMLTADINSGNIRLLYTTTSTGTSATMKYKVQKW